MEAAAAALSLHGCLECTTQPDQVRDAAPGSIAHLQYREVSSGSSNLERKKTGHSASNESQHVDARSRLFKKNKINKYGKKERYEYVKLYFTGTFQDKKTTPFKYHPHQEQTCLSSVCTYIYICMPHCRFFFFSFRSQRRRKLQESLRGFTRGEKAQSSRYSPSSVHSLILGCVRL